MTETSPYPFGEPGPVDQPSEATEATATDRRRVLLLAGLGAVVLGAGAYLLLGGSAEEETYDVALPAPRSSAAAPVPSPLPTVPQVSAVQLGRNPFKALYVAPAAASQPVGGTPATGTSLPTALPTSLPTSPPTSMPGATGAGPAVPSPGGASSAPIVVTGGGGSQSSAPALKPKAAVSTVSISKVDKKQGDLVVFLRYDGKDYSGKQGDVLAKRLKVLSIQQDDATGSWFVTLRLGDGTPFEVHERQTVVVQ